MVSVQVWSTWINLNSRYCVTVEEVSEQNQAGLAQGILGPALLARGDPAEDDDLNLCRPSTSLRPGLRFLWSYSVSTRLSRS